MRLALSKEQWDKLCDNTDSISSFPATVGNFLTHFTNEHSCGNFNISYDAKRKIFGVWFDDVLERFEEKELIDALFNLFCSIERI